MATILTSSAVTVIANLLLAAGQHSPVIAITRKRPIPAFEVILTTPDAGTCTILTEWSLDSTHWTTLARDSFDAQVPLSSKGGSSFVRFFTRPTLNSTAACFVRASVPTLTGSPWRGTLRVDF